VLVWERVDQDEVAEKMGDMIHNPQSEHERYVAAHVIPELGGVDPPAGPPRDEEDGDNRGRLGQTVVLRVRALVLVGLAAALVCGVGARPAVAGGRSRSTALIVSQSGPAFVVRGSDRRLHIEYDLLTTNATPAPVTLTSIEVLGPRGRVLRRLSGAALASVTAPLQGFGAASATIPASGVVDTLIDVVLPRGQPPRQLSHRIRYALPPGDPFRAFVQSEVIRGPRVRVDTRRALIVAPPVRGSGWLVLNGCCGTLESTHSLVRLAVNGSDFQHPETFAIDWVREEGGRLFTGNGAALRDHFAFGAAVSSSTSGVVVSARDGFPEQTPAILQEPPAGITQGNYLGNYVIVRVRPGVYAYYAHLERGSVAVKVKQRVKTGQRLARLGDSGNSTTPHLHWGFLDTPNPQAANSLPFEFRRFTLVGSFPGNPFTEPIRVRGPSGVRKSAYPLVFSVVNFH
jgi:Peptidase family M23